jgi:hypothetical protein
MKPVLRLASDHLTNAARGPFAGTFHQKVEIAHWGTVKSVRIEHFEDSTSLEEPKVYATVVLRF